MSTFRVSPCVRNPVYGPPGPAPGVGTDCLNGHAVYLQRNFSILVVSDRKRLGVDIKTDRLHLVSYRIRNLLLIRAARNGRARPSAGVVIYDSDRQMLDFFPCAVRV